ncbi:MAG: SPFH/Band 7/PHB domain protein [Gammaproteobacteria bacterium]|nr:SPFH/Band 7/PHB domain protein [Gammaproteobacteria bacterium]
MFMAVVNVPQGMQYTVTRFEKYHKTLEPGFNWLIPFYDSVDKKVDMREQVLDVPSQDVITADNASVVADGVVFYQIVDARNASYEISDLKIGILNLVTTNIRGVLGSKNLDEVQSQRQEISEALVDDVDEVTGNWGVKILRIKIKDITPPQDVVDSMARQLKADRDKRAAILEAQGEKESAINKAEGEKTSLILQAEGEKQARVLHAEGEKEARILKAEGVAQADELESASATHNASEQAKARRFLAEAEADATKMISKELADGDIQAINYFVAEKYIDALKHLAAADNQKVILMPLEASSLIGAVNGIREIATAAFNRNEE